MDLSLVSGVTAVPFTHLHVSAPAGAAHGALAPDALAEAALADAALAVAWTERDGMYSAAEHIAVCLRRGLAPIVGVDLAILAEPAEPAEGERRPRRGSAGVAGRVVVLAQGDDGGAGWRALCRLVGDAHAHTRSALGRRGSVPVGVLRSELAERCLDPQTGRPSLTVLLGPESEVGLALSGRKFLRPRTLFREWMDTMPAGVLAVELVTHLTPAGAPFSTGHAVRLLRLAAEHGVPAVLTNAVGGVSPQDDDEAWLKPEAVMRGLGEEIIRAAGMRRADLENLLANTERIAQRCRLVPAADVGWVEAASEAAPVDVASDPAVGDRALESVRRLGIRAVRSADGAIEVEHHARDRALRGIVEEFSVGQAALVGAWVEPAPNTSTADAEGLVALDPERVRAPIHDAWGIAIGAEGVLERLPIEPGPAGVPMIQFGPAEAARLGLITLRVRGIHEQSAIAFAVREIARLHGPAAVPADQSEHGAWLAVEHPEALLAGALEHPGPGPTAIGESAAAEAPGEVPWAPILGVDINASGTAHRLERIVSGPQTGRTGVRRPFTVDGGLSPRDAAKAAAGQPYASMAEVRDRAGLSAAAVRRLAALGAFDSLHRAEADRQARARVVAEIAGLAGWAGAGRPVEAVEGQLALDLDACRVG